MKIHAIHHVAHEGLGAIEDWLVENRMSFSESRLHDNASLPGPEEFDGLIVMGGSMSVHDTKEHPWLSDEKDLITQSMAAGKKVLGICLGSQLVAECLGARVYKNPGPEVGWFPVKKEFLLHSWFPEYDDHEEITFFHWHGDTFDLPRGAVHLFSSRACRNQGFSFDNHVLALQFHPEMKEKNVRQLIQHSSAALKESSHTQTEDQIIEYMDLHLDRSRMILYHLLDYFFEE